MATHVGTHRRLDVIGVVARVIDWLFGALYALLFVRFALELVGARDVGIVRIIGDVSEVFAAPFRGIFGTTGHLAWPLLVAMLGYMLLHVLIRGALHLVWRGT